MSGRLSRDGSMDLSNGNGARELMGTFIGIVSSHIDNLSGERLETKPPPTRRMRKSASSRRVYRPPTMAILGSSDPSSDANTIKRLFPNRFRNERAHNSVLLIENGSAGPLHLMLVDCNEQNHRRTNSLPGMAAQAVMATASAGSSMVPLSVGGVGSSGNTGANGAGAGDAPMPVHWKNVTLFMREKDIRYAMEQCRGKYATVFHHETVEDSSLPKWAALTVIRLGGGGNLVLLTPSFLRCRAGRTALARYVAMREQHEAADHHQYHNTSMGTTVSGRHGTMSKTRAILLQEEEDVLKQLEDAVDPRSMRRRSSDGTSHVNNGVGGTTTTTMNPPLSPLQFTSLSVSLQRRHGFMQNDIPINAPNPITFETDLFVGKLLVLMRPEEEDPMDAVYSNFFEGNDQTVSCCVCVLLLLLLVCTGSSTLITSSS